MPSFIESAPQQSGKTGYIYDISNDDVIEVASEIIRNADSTFVFQGKIGDDKHNLQHPEFVVTPLKKGGVVGATVPFGGERVKVLFTSLDEMLLIPSDGDRFTAEALIGAATDAGFEDSFDEFEDDALDSFEDDDFDGETMSDPRGKSVPLEYYEENGVLDMSQGASGGDGGMSIASWAIMLVVLMIPVVNLIFLILWLVSKKTPTVKKNYLKAYVIVTFAFAVLLSAGGFFALKSGLVENITQQVAGMMFEKTMSNLASGYDLDELQDQLANLEDMATNISSNENDNENSNENENANGNLNDFDDMANLNGNMNSNDNSNSLNPNSNVVPPTQLDSNIATLAGATTTEVNGYRFVVFTITVKNTNTQPLAPLAFLDITARQGQNALDPNFAEFNGFAPSTFSEPIAPGMTGTFQVSYNLRDDQDVVLNVSDKQTKQTLISETTSV